MFSSTFTSDWHAQAACQPPCSNHARQRNQPSRLTVSHRTAYPQSDIVSANPRSELHQQRRRTAKREAAIRADLRLGKAGIMNWARWIALELEKLERPAA
jgi:hypothetical protein